jgi:hypothetical protein
VTTLAALLVGKPLTIAAVATLFAAAHVLLPQLALGPRRHPRALLVAAAAWLLYAAWEWLVQVRTPEANIRVDLLVLWPALAVVSIWMVVRALQRLPQ